jgi:hypothetical protein
MPGGSVGEGVGWGVWVLVEVGLGQGVIVEVGPGVQVSGSFTGVLGSLVLIIVRGMSSSTVGSGRTKQPDIISTKKAKDNHLIDFMSCTPIWVRINPTHLII